MKSAALSARCLKSILCCFVVCYLKLPKSFSALRSKQWSQILFNVGFLQGGKQGGEERNRVLGEEEVMEEEK